MITINEENESIEISECLAFSGKVQEEYNKILEDQQFDLENSPDIFSSDDIENVKKFVNHILTHEDKLKILEYIMDEYDRSSNYFDNQSIFDEDLIQKGIEDWINDNFDLNL